MERIINERLQWFLENDNLMNQCQAGNRKGRSTMDNLFKLTEELRNPLQVNTTIQQFSSISKRHTAHNKTKNRR